MYVNKCIKCGKEFETKNPKRVICPECLYPERKLAEGEEGSTEKPQQFYSAGGYDNQPKTQYTNGYSTDNREYQNRSYNRPQQRYNQQGGYSQNRSYNRPQQRYNQQGGYSQNRNSSQRFGQQNRNNYNNRRPGGFNNRRSGMKPKPKQKTLLVNREQLEQIELLYKQMLPLPNPDAHEVISEKIGLEPRKVFFGINLVRQKMMLPKLSFPKRKLAISPDQMFAIQNLYEPLLPLPPIGCHKIIAAQLKMDEWRVHVGIGLIRKKLGLERWNQDRPDCPEEFKNQAEKTEDKPKKTSRKKKTDEDVKIEESNPEEKKTKTRKKKEPQASAADKNITEETVEEKPKRTTRKKKAE